MSDRHDRQRLNRSLGKRERSRRRQRKTGFTGGAVSALDRSRKGGAYFDPNPRFNGENRIQI